MIGENARLSKLAMPDILLVPRFTQYSDSGLSTLSCKFACLFPEFLHLYLFHALKDIAKKETKRQP